MTTTRIEFTQALRSAPPRSATRVRRQAVFACTVVAVLVAIALVVPVIAFLGHRVPADLWFGFALLTFGGILILTNAARNLRALRRVTAPEVRLGAPYAFEISGSSIHFPESFNQRPETWPLAGTTVVAGRWLGLRAVTLSREDRKARRYLGMVLELSPERVADIVGAAQK